LVIMEKQLKIGFIVPESLQLPAWYLDTITRVSRRPDTEAYFIMLNKRHEEKKKRLRFAVRLFQRFEKKWFGLKDHAANFLEADHLVDDKHRLQFDITPDGPLPPEQLVSLQRYALDLVYSVDFDPQQEENISAATRLGLWYILFGHGK